MQTEILIIAVLSAMACALPGVFLVLKKMSMLSDSVTHTVLLGIVLAFFATQDLNSPWLIIGAAAMGLFTVWLTESAHRTGLMSEESSIGLIFPLLFSIAIILITKYAGNIHLDTDSVLMGELAFAPFERLELFGYDIGAKAAYVMGGILLLNGLLFTLLYKEFKLSIFDGEFSALIGFSPVILHYLLMASVSVTAVGAFEAVGSVLVVAFMVGPAVTARLLTDRLGKTVGIALGIAAVNAVVGYIFADLLDVSIAGSIAVVTGLSFMLTLLAAPQKGIIPRLVRRKANKLYFYKITLLYHFYNHRNSESVEIEAGLNTVSEHLAISEKLKNKLIADMSRDKWVYVGANDIIRLTADGIYELCQAANNLFA